MAEIVDAAALRGAPAVIRALVEAAAGIPSRRLGERLARFDADVAKHGVAIAARTVLRAFGATV